VEQDAHAAATYRLNLVRGRHKPRLIEEDIRDLDATRIASETLGKYGPVALILGGPPCQGFSAHRLRDAGVSDARNNLIHVYFEFVHAFAPAAFLMENVPGMLWPRHKATLERFYSAGNEAGYDVLPAVVLDARDYGVPQRRRRVFILGLRRGIDRSSFTWPPPATHGSRKVIGLKTWRDCSPAFRPARAGDPNDKHMNHCAALIEAFARTPANGGSRAASGRLLPCHDGHDGHNDVYGRIDPSKPAPTMTTACINPSKGRFVHPTLHHGITIRQAARIQTFPDDFIFEGGLMAAGRQVGNAVPIDLARQLIEHLKPLLAASLQHQDRASAPDAVGPRLRGHVPLPRGGVKSSKLVDRDAAGTHGARGNTSGALRRHLDPFGDQSLNIPSEELALAPDHFDLRQKWPKQQAAEKA
jgi:DNA (cytosine-5)-methyltransferase 1